MRHLVFVLVLVAAAFAGGAVFNGPGLAWVRQNVIGGPTVVADPSAAPASRPPRRFPTAPDQPVLADLTSPASPSTPSPAPTPTVAPNGLASAAPVTRPEAPRSQPTLAAPTIGTPGPPQSAPPPLELPGESTPKVDPTARLASGTEPTPVVPTLNPVPADNPVAAPGRDWAGVRARLKEAGVTRYGVEGDLAGRVRFSCVIPVEGLRAVGHHFEAEGDDEFQAAEATLRRIALWRATEPSRGGP